MTTILSGEVVNTNQFGPGGPMDWDGSKLVDVISTHTDDRLAYTWKNNFSSFPPSRIDFHIISGSVMDIEKSYTLQTETMSADRLDEYGLLPFDVTIASDHLPKVTDLLLPMPVATNNEVENELRLAVFPNPVTDQCDVSFTLEKSGNVKLTLQTTNGQVVQDWYQRFPSGKQRVQINVHEIIPGLYNLTIATKDKFGSLKIIKE